MGSVLGVRLAARPQRLMRLRENALRAEMISVQTLLVAILGGLGGGLLGTWLQIRHERAEAFRERLITAADDLSTGLLQAVIGLNDAYSVCLKHGFLTAQSRIALSNPATGETPSETDEALKRAKALVGEASARRARVALLFGPVSAPDRSATLALDGLEGSLRALDGWPVPDLEAFSGELASARKYLDQFNEWALRDIQGRPWFARWRAVVWLRRRWRKLR